MNNVQQILAWIWYPVDKIIEMMKDPKLTEALGYDVSYFHILCGFIILGVVIFTFVPMTGALAGLPRIGRRDSEKPNDSIERSNDG